MYSPPITTERQRAVGVHRVRVPEALEHRALERAQGGVRGGAQLLAHRVDQTLGDDQRFLTPLAVARLGTFSPRSISTSA